MGIETTAVTADGFLIGGTAATSRLENGRVIVHRGGIEERLFNAEDGFHQEWRFPSAPPAGNIIVDVAVTSYRYVSTTNTGLHFANKTGAGFRYSHAVWTGSDGVDWPVTGTYADGQIRFFIPEEVIARTAFPAVLDPTITAEEAVDAPVVGPTGMNQQAPAIAFNGFQYLVVWEDNRDSADGDIWGTRLTPDGAILDPLGIRIAAGPGVQSNPTVAWIGGVFLVAWEDFKVNRGTEADIVATNVGPGGDVGGTTVVSATPMNELRPNVAAGGPSGEAFLVWNANGDISGSVFSNIVFGPTFSIGTGAELEQRPAVASNGAADYLVAWSAASDLQGRLVFGDGTPGPAFPISAGLGAQVSPDATFVAGNYAVVWTNISGGARLFGTRVTTDGAVLDTHAEGEATVGGVSLSSAPEPIVSRPSIDCQAASCIALWQDRRNADTTGFDVFGQSLNADLTLRGTEFTVTTATGGQFAPVAAPSSTGFVSAWADFRDNAVLAIVGGSLSPDGVVGPLTGFGTGNNRESAPSLGRAGAVFGLFWTDSRTVGSDIRYVRFGANNGAKLDETPFAAAGTPFAQLDGAASTELGGNVLVAWTDSRNAVDKDIFAARVSLANATTLEPAGIALGTAAGDQLGPAVASNGSLALVVWQDRRSGAFDIRGALVNAAGAVVAGDIAISTAAGDQVRAAVAWSPTSSQFIVVWEDARAGTERIFGTRVSTAGAALDPNGVIIGAGPVGQFAPAIASTSTTTFVVWQDRRNSAAGGNYNVFGTRVAGGATLFPLNPSGVRISNNTGKQSQPAISSFGNGYIVAWTDDRNTQTDVFGQQLTATGGLVNGEFAIANSPDSESAATLLSVAGSEPVVRVAYEVNRLNTARVATRQITSQLDRGSVCSDSSACASGFCVDGFCCDSECGGNHAGPNGLTAGDCHGCSRKYTGQANGTCAPIPQGGICRNYASTTCDLRELCDGVSFTCGDDVGRNAGQACQLSSNETPGEGTGVCAETSPFLCVSDATVR